ncbi:MAG TPA: hypothetical protein VHT03_03530 [Rhizomicrobium sp.]|jgi:hypothetical protein|nr:hypothetical protein [Rhizomicrobium sp.]
MNARGAELRVCRLIIPRQANEWLAVPQAVYAGDPNFIPQLNLIEKQRINPKKAPFFTFGEAAFFVAYRGTTPVGRVTAQVNRRHLEFHGDNAGHFGFFDCTNDPEAARALVESAQEWLKERGLSSMMGPFSFSINEECGCLVSGFDSPPAMLMPHGAPWIGKFLEEDGFAKVIDLYAYRTKPERLPPRIAQLADRAARFGNIALRQFDMRRYRAEIDLLVDIYNDAWSDSWGFVPFSTAEIDSLAHELKPFFRNEYGRFLMLDGTEVGFAVGLPDLNGIIAHFGGRLFPFNWLRLIWSMKRETWRTGRIPFLGVRRECRTTPRGSALVVLLVKDLVEQASSRYRMDWAEYSWVRQTDSRMVSLGEAIAGPPAKTYRIYAKPI